MKYYNKLLIFVICSLLFLPANAQVSNNPLTLKKDDRWCAIGSSITQRGGYLEVIYLYYATRFPHQRFEIFNCGSGGDTATGAFTRRLDKDILGNKPTVTSIMFGMNDIWWEKSGLYPTENYARNLENLIDKLEAEDSRVILITTSPYDYSVKSDEPVDPKRLGLERLVNEMIQLGVKRNIPVVDFYNPMLQMTLGQQKLDSTFTLLTTDRVHTKPLADFVMGYTFLKASDASRFVSKVVIDAQEKLVVEQENCQLDDFKVDGSTIRFSLLENALPYPKVAIPHDGLYFVDFNTDFNQELLQLTGLASGQYTLFIDDVEVGNYTESELSYGINLAFIGHTPQNKQAQQLADIMSEYTQIVEHKTRYITMMEYGELKKRYPIDDTASPKADITKQFSKNSERFDEYLELKKDESLWIKRAEELKEELWQHNKPQIHYYRLVKSTSNEYMICGEF